MMMLNCYNYQYVNEKMIYRIIVTISYKQKEIMLK